MGVEYGADGKLNKAFPVCLTLADDGTAEYMDATGTWKYVESENFIYVNDLEIGCPLKPVEVDGYVGLEYVPVTGDDPETFFGPDYYIYTFFKEEPDCYTSDIELIVGDWYTYNGSTVSFMPDGTIQHNTDIELSNWSITCIGPYSIVDIGHDFPGLFDTKAGSLVSLDFRAPTFYSGKHSTLITVDNWREYFSENCTDSFEIITKEFTDEWGEPDTESYVTFKDVDKYTDGTHLLVEVDGPFGIEQFHLGLEPEAALGLGDYENCKILRMKGLLVENP